jgi:hypothetical protein
LAVVVSKVMDIFSAKNKKKSVEQADFQKEMQGMRDVLSFLFFDKCNHLCEKHIASGEIPNAIHSELTKAVQSAKTNLGFDGHLDRQMKDLEDIKITYD